MKKGKSPSKLIRNASIRYNSIVEKWESSVYFMIKDDTSKDEDVWLFLNFLIN